jgi:hypothetical protein
VAKLDALQQRWLALTSHELADSQRMWTTRTERQIKGLSFGGLFTIVPGRYQFVKRAGIFCTLAHRKHAPDLPNRDSSKTDVGTPLHPSRRVHCDSECGIGPENGFGENMFHYRKSFSAEHSLRELAFEIEYRLGVSIRNLNAWLSPGSSAFR